MYLIICENYGTNFFLCGRWYFVFMTYEYILPAIFLILSNLMKAGFTTNKNVFDTGYDFLSGLPVDLTFVATSVILLSSGGLNNASLMSALICLLVGGVQSAFVYKGQIKLLDDKKTFFSFLAFLLNITITGIVYYVICFYEVKL